MTWSRSKLYPRQVPMVSRPESELSRELLSAEGRDCKLGMVCKPSCLFRSFANIFPSIRKQVEGGKEVSFDADKIQAIFDVLEKEFNCDVEGIDGVVLSVTWPPLDKFFTKLYSAIASVDDVQEQEKPGKPVDVSKNLLEPSMDDQVIEYRKVISGKTGGTDTHVAKVELVWKASWPGITNLSSFCGEDRSVTFNMYAREAFRPLQPHNRDDKALMHQCMQTTEGETMIFVGVANKFVDILDYVKGIKFSASPAYLQDSRNVRKMFKEFDLMLFVKNFDRGAGHCHCGFIYHCRDIKGYVGVLLLDGYQKLTQWLEIGQAVTLGYLKDEARKLNQHYEFVIRDLVKLASELYEKERKDKNKKADYYKCRIVLDREEKGQKLRLVKSYNRVPPRKVLEEFADRFGKRLDHFTFTYSDGSKVGPVSELQKGKEKEEIDSGGRACKVFHLTAVENGTPRIPRLVHKVDDSTIFDSLSLSAVTVRSGPAGSSQPPLESFLIFRWQTLRIAGRAAEKDVVCDVVYSGDHMLYRNGGPTKCTVKEELPGSTVCPMLIGRKYGFDPIKLTVSAVATKKEKPQKEEAMEEDIKENLKESAKKETGDLKNKSKVANKEASTATKDTKSAASVSKKVATKEDTAPVADELQSRITKFASALTEVRKGSKGKDKLTKKRDEDKNWAENITVGQFLGLTENNLDEFVARTSEIVKEMGGDEDTEELRVCSECKKEDFDMPLCRGCGVTTFCSQKCQDDGWKTHQKGCKEIRLTRIRDLIATIVSKGSLFDNESSSEAVRVREE